MVKYLEQIKGEAQKGRPYRYYKFWVLLSLFVATIAMVYVYFFMGLPQIVRDIIFFLLFVTIGITNYQSLWVAMDFAKSNEAYSEAYRNGGVFLGTFFSELMQFEIELAKKEGRKPRSMEKMAKSMAGMMFMGLRNIEPITEECKKHGITASDVTAMALQAVKNKDVMQKWFERMEKMMPLFEVIADAVAANIDNIDNKKFGMMVGRKISEMMKNGGGTK